LATVFRGTKVAQPQLADAKAAYYTPTADAYFVIKKDDSLWAIGDNRICPLGNGDDIKQETFVKIMNGVDSLYFSGRSYGATEMSVMALKTDGTLWAWGVSAFFTKSDGSNSTYIEKQWAPVKVADKIQQVISADNLLFLKTDGTVVGYDSDGTNNPLGGWVTYAENVVKFEDNGEYNFWTPDGKMYVSYDANGLYTRKGNIWSAIWKEYGDKNFVAIQNHGGSYPYSFNGNLMLPDNMYCIKRDGALYGLGGNNTGAGGNLANNDARFHSDTFVKILDDVKEFSRGSLTAIKNDGTLWAWGFYPYVFAEKSHLKAEPVKVMDNVYCYIDEYRVLTKDGAVIKLEKDGYKAEMTNLKLPAVKLPPIKIALNGKLIATDAVPYLDAKGTMMLPVAAVTSALGAKTSSDDAAKTTTITKGDTKIKVTVGSDKINVNGKDATMSAAAVLTGKTLYVPAKYVLEALGYKSEWDAVLRVYRINS
jgi:alpha-tubulin suppressor-like RCC1 family protein